MRRHAFERDLDRPEYGLRKGLTVWRRIFLFALPTAWLLLPGCSRGADPAENASPLEIAFRILDESGSASQTTFQTGEGITFELALRNVDSRPHLLTLASSKTHDFAVTSSAGEVVWRSSDGRFYTQMLTEITLAPGETRRFRSTWSQICSNGRKAESGEFRAVGSVATLPPIQGPTPSAFTIR